MTSNAPPTYRSIFFFLFFFSPLPFLSREYRFLSRPRRVFKTSGYHRGRCADSRIGIKFQYAIILDPDFFYPIRLISLLAIPILIKLYRD